jgi:hypothetical protein
MSIFSRFFKKPKPKLTPYERTTQAVDELNAALKELRKDEDYKNIRPFTTSYNPVTKKRGQVILCFWNDGKFDVIYQGTSL